MNTLIQGQVNSYASTRGEVSGREADAQALLQCANQLRTALDDNGKDFLAYGNALRRNQKLWTMFQVALTEPENIVPDDLKNTLLSLSMYVDKVSFRAANSFAPEILKSLIDINITIATGLRAKPPEAAQPQQYTTSLPAATGEAPKSVTISA